MQGLQNNIERLRDDHIRAATLEAGLTSQGYQVQPPRTNMVYVDVQNGPEAQHALEAHGVRCLAVSDTALRIVTHLDVDDTDIQRTIEAFAALKKTQATT